MARISASATGTHGLHHKADRYQSPNSIARNGALPPLDPGMKSTIDPRSDDCATRIGDGDLWPEWEGNQNRVVLSCSGHESRVLQYIQLEGKGKKGTFLGQRTKRELVKDVQLQRTCQIPAAPRAFFDSLHSSGCNKSEPKVDLMFRYYRVFTNAVPAKTNCRFRDSLCRVSNVQGWDSRTID